MGILSFIAEQPLLALVLVLMLVVLGYVSHYFFSKGKSGISVLVMLAMLGAIYMYSGAYAGALREGTVKTVVVMPNKQNLRLGEDGNLAFCIDGFARNWEQTRDGIISTSPRSYKGRPMRCLSVEEGIEFLRQNGASDEELQSMRSAYDLE